MVGRKRDAQVAAPGAARAFLEFRGTLRDRREFTLLAVHEHAEIPRAAAADQRPGTHAIEGRLLDARGRLLARARPTLSTGFEDPGHESAPSVWLRVILPLLTGGVKAALAVDGTVVWSAPIAARPPALSATAAVERAAVRVTWTARPRVPVDVLAIDPESKTRRPLGRRIVASPMRVPIAALPGGPVAFLVRAAAGMREATVTTKPVALPSRGPTVEILAAPGDSPAGQPVTIRGAVVDSWGRVTPDAVIEWTLNGTVVGTGSSVTIAPPPGRHELGASVRNQNARQSATVQVSEPTADAIRWRRALEDARRAATRPGRASFESPAGPPALDRD